MLLFRVLAQMTGGPRSRVLHRGALSAAYQPGMGWEQGDTLAATMFTVFIDAVLREVWAAHPGVPLPAPAAALPAGVATQASATEPDDKLVALAYADDCAAVAGSPEEMQSLTDVTHAALSRWRLKASVDASDASKTAIMVVRARPRSLSARRSAAAAAAAAEAAAAAATSQQQWWWGTAGGMAIPAVRTYTYLGVVLTDDASWGAHLEHRLRQAGRAARAQQGVLRDPRLPLSVRRLALTAVVQPCVTYAAQVWSRDTAAQRRQLDSWQTQTVAWALGCPPNATQVCLQQELGVVPLHVTCAAAALRYWHRLRHLPADRLVVRALRAWGHDAGWASALDGLARSWGLAAGAFAWDAMSFAQHIARRAGAYVAAAWRRSAAANADGIAARYTRAFGPAASAPAR
ncbi:hypothetical protein HT031_005053 [Scenedesmus sp. PABB004]|nr:hypothetical protein HT031_005053 [Scenedesmus sp. PABB004]